MNPKLNLILNCYSRFNGYLGSRIQKKLQMKVTKLILTLIPDALTKSMTFRQIRNRVQQRLTTILKDVSVKSNDPGICSCYEAISSLHIQNHNSPARRSPFISIVAFFSNRWVYICLYYEGLLLI